MKWRIINDRSKSNNGRLIHPTHGNKHPAMRQMGPDTSMPGALYIGGYISGRMFDAEWRWPSEVEAADAEAEEALKAFDLDAARRTDAAIVAERDIRKQQYADQERARRILGHREMVFGSHGLMLADMLRRLVDSSVLKPEPDGYIQLRIPERRVIDQARDILEQVDEQLAWTPERNVKEAA